MNTIKTNEIKLERIYDAPLQTVWDAWTDLEQVAQWWGPRGFTITTHSKDLRPGGIWHYTMHGPDGTDYVNKTLYHEVVPGSKLLYDHGGNDEQAPLFRVCVLFKAAGNKTHLTLTMSLPTPEAAAEARVFIKKAGGESTWDRLGEHLGKRTQGKDLFIINRSFAAPIERIFEFWTDPKHSAQWTPPTGFTMEFLRADIRQGGETFYRMTNGKDVTMYGRAHYLEINRPSRVVYTQQFCDDKEQLSRHPLAPTWPATMLTVVSLTAEGPAQTRVTVEWEPYGDVQPAELATFIAARAGMSLGWTGSFDKLEAFIENIVSR